MAKESCECKGLNLFTEIVTTTLDLVNTPGKKVVFERALKVAQNSYNHLLEQANKPENELMFAEVTGLFDKMRKEIGDGHGMYALERVRDCIHKSPALQQLMACGGPYKIPEDRTEAALTIDKVSNLMAGDDDDIDKALPLLKTVSTKLGC